MTISSADRVDGDMKPQVQLRDLCWSISEWLPPRLRHRVTGCVLILKDLRRLILKDLRRSFMRCPIKLILMGNTEQVKEEFASLLSKNLESRPFMPYLFLGSGISRRYLALPNWEQLLRIFAAEAGLDFDYLNASHNHELPRVASEIAAAFHEKWWNDDVYADQRNRHKEDVSDREGALKVAVSEWLSARDGLSSGVPGVDDPELAKEVDLLSRVVVDGIITTNYDSFAAQIFPDFKQFVGQQGLLIGDAEFIAETYLIHGSSNSPSTLVLTKADYESFRTRNPYLAAKLLTIFAERPVIFAGYSLQDQYLNDILDDVFRAAGEMNIDKLGSRIYFIEWNQELDSPILERASIERWGARFAITRIETNDYGWIWETLASLERGFSGVMLRELKSSLYQLVEQASTDARLETVVAVPLESEQAQSLKVVFGLGGFPDTKDGVPVEISSRLLQRDEIVEDAMGINVAPLPTKAILEFGIPKHLKPRKDWYIPVWKYLAADDRVDYATSSANFAGLDPIVQVMAERKLLFERETMARLEREFGGRLPNCNELVASQNKTYFKVGGLICLAYKQVQPEELREAAVKLWDKIDSTDRAKLACAYDHLVYSPYRPETRFEPK